MVLWPTLAVVTLWAGMRSAGWRRVALLGGPALALALLAVQVACGPSGGGGGPSNTPSPSVSLSPTSLAFGAQPVQTTSAPQSVTLTNTGNATLNVTNISAASDFAQTNSCGSSLSAGANCAINVTFTPTAVGSRGGALSISDNAAGSPHTVSLTGQGQTGGTPAGSYTIGVTGTSGTLVQSGAVTLVVQ